MDLAAQNILPMRKKSCLPLAFLVLTATNSVLLASDTKSPTSDLTELNLEDIMKIEVATVSGASKFEQKVTDAPAPITIITSGDIPKHGYRTLRSVRGFYITCDQNYAYAAVRGLARPSLTRTGAPSG